MTDEDDQLRLFEEVVERALDSLPEHLARAVSNVQVVIEHEHPTEPDIYGYYSGIPLTERGIGYAGVLPDKISIYQTPLHGGFRSRRGVARRRDPHHRAARARPPLRCRGGQARRVSAGARQAPIAPASGQAKGPSSLRRCTSASRCCPTPLPAGCWELLEHAETRGFGYGWTYDSHILWQECMPLLTMMAMRTSTMKVGLCVTNPGTRDPTVLASAHATVQDISSGRCVMGIGRGDSARRTIGLNPVRMAEYEAACVMMKELMDGRPAAWNDKELQLEWARDLPEIPLFLAGYGPKALAVAGRVSDGVIIPARRP